MCGVSTTLGTSSSARFTTGSPSNTSSPAAASGPSRNARASAASSTMPPRAMLTSVAPGFIRASCAAPIRWCVCAEYGSTSTTWSEVASSVSSSTRAAPSSASFGAGLRLVYCRRIEKPLARRATAEPIRPMPTMPSVAPCTSAPRNWSQAQRPHLPSRSQRSDSVTRRAVAISSAQAMSAVASVSTSGVLVTGMPRAVQAATSIWL